MEKFSTPQSIIESRGNKEFKYSSIDNRVRGLHTRLVEMLKDPNYDIGHAYLIAKQFSDFDILSAADYCVRKANHPGKAFVGLFAKKMAK